MPVDVAAPLVANASAYDRALEQSMAARIEALDIDAINRAQDPWQCPEELLDFLAFDRAVDIWDDAWPTWKKRSVIASAPRDHRLNGTEAGAHRYLEISDARLVQCVTPPQGFYASPDLTKEQWDALIAKHPKIRVTLSRGRGEYRVPGGVFADQAASDHACVTLDDGRALLGRRAFLVKDGQAQPLQLLTRQTSVETREATLIERIVVPGKTANSAVADASFTDNAFADATDKAPAWYSYALTRSYLHEESNLSLNTVAVGFEARDTRFRRESERGQRGLDCFVGDAAGTTFAEPDRAGDLLADVLYLYDPAIGAPQVSGMSFAGHSRVGMKHHTAEMLVDWQERLTAGTAFIANQSFADQHPARDNDTTRRNRLLDALARSGRLSDRIRVSFQTRRERTLGDGLPLDGSARLADPVPNYL